MIRVNQLSKKFELADPAKLKQQAQQEPRLKGRFFYSLQNVSFQCARGQVLGLLGPNGAGKTTTLRILSTALKPNSGEIFIDDDNLTQQPHVLRQKLGFLSGSTGLYNRLTGRENITYFGELHGLEARVIRERINSIAQELDMQHFLDRRCETYSAGMKQKTAIARAVIHRPEVVVLDEPTTGLDIMATQTVLAFIERLKQQNVAVVFSTHHLDEVQSLCDKVCVINQGNSVFHDDFQVFASRSSESLHQAFINCLQAVQ